MSWLAGKAGGVARTRAGGNVIDALRDVLAVQLVTPAGVQDPA